MDALLGVAFVAQLPSEEPKVVFEHPPQQEAPTGPCAAGAGLPGADAEARADSLDPGADDKKVYFGIPGDDFALLMLPSDEKEICNRPFYLQLDAGRRETKFVRHEPPNSHLHFVGFPCNVAEFILPSTRQSGRDMVDIQQKKVRHFNIVFVLDARRTKRLDKHTSTLWEVSAHLSRALVSEEARVGYLSTEIRRLMNSHPGGERKRLGLDRLLSDAFDGVSTHGYRSLRVNGSILCNVCLFPKDETPVPPSQGQALVLTCPREELRQELPLDSDIVRAIVDAASPMKSLEELMAELALPLSTLQRLSQHLVYWKKACVVDVFRPETRVAVVPRREALTDTTVALRFAQWRKKHLKEKGGDLAEVTSAFSGGPPLEIVQGKLSLVEGEMAKVLEWFVAEGMLVQRAEYCHFVPDGADEARHRDRLEELDPALVDEFCPEHLSEEELHLLRKRSEDTSRLRFLCNFVVRVARAHHRMDT